MWESTVTTDTWITGVQVNGEKVRFRSSDIKRYESVGKYTKVKFYYGEEILLIHPISQLDRAMSLNQQEETENGETQ